MFNSVLLSKNLEKEINQLFFIFLGNEKDEYEELYKNVYVHEINSFIISVENSIDLLKEANIPISYLEIRNTIIQNWNISIEENYDLNKLNQLCQNLYNNSLVLKHKDDNSFSTELNDDEKDFLKSCLSNKMNHCRKELLKIHLKEDDFFNELKKINEEKYYSLIEYYKKDYIISVNLLYKLYNWSPKNWDTDYSLHNAVVKSFKLNKSDFIFK